MNTWRRRLAVVAALGLGGLAVWGFIKGRNEGAMEAERERPVKAPLRVSTVNGEAVLTIDAATQRLGGITVVALQSAAYDEPLRAYGTVLDLQELTDLSNGYANARAQLQTAKAKLSASRTAYERAETLYKNRQIISAAQYQADEATFRVDDAAAGAAESQVRTIASTALQSWGPVLARALEEHSPMLVRLIGHEAVLLQVTLPPRASLAKPPTTAFILGDDGSRNQIQFVSPATRADPSIQGVSLFYLAPATTGLLAGMKVIVFLAEGKAIDGMVVPASSVVWWQGRAWIYLRTGPQTFTRHEMPTDVPAADGGYVVSGLPTRAELVTQGAQLLLSEELRARIQIGDEGD
jgi:hypothetical protein